MLHWRSWSGPGLTAITTASASWSTAFGARSATPAKCSGATHRTGWTSGSGRTGRHCNERIGRPGGLSGKPPGLRGTPPQRGPGRCPEPATSHYRHPAEPEHDVCCFPLPGVCPRGGPGHLTQDRLDVPACTHLSAMPCYSPRRPGEAARRSPDMSSGSGRHEGTAVKVRC
jgi:hypothetical protein